MCFPKQSKMALLAAVVLAGLYGVNYFVTPDLVGIAELETRCRPAGDAPFKSDLWKRATPASGGRYRMVDDLLTTRRVINLDSAQIENLLGKPDLLSDKDGERLVFYFLGDQRVYPSKSIWFPGLFPNNDRWMLQIRLREGKAYAAKVFFT